MPERAPLVIIQVACDDKESVVVHLEVASITRNYLIPEDVGCIEAVLAAIAKKVGRELGI